MNKKALAYNSWERFFSFALKTALRAISLNATINNNQKLNQQNWRCRLKR
jgi:hypothetical protein